MRKIIVDGYNLMSFLGLMEDKKNKVFFRMARLELIEFLAKFLAKKQKMGRDLEVVFDGKKRGTLWRKGIKIIFTSKKETADDFIKREVKNNGVWMVVTNDRELCQELKEIQPKIKLKTAREFLKFLEEK